VFAGNCCSKQKAYRLQSPSGMGISWILFLKDLDIDSGGYEQKLRVINQQHKNKTAAVKKNC